MKTLRILACLCAFAGAACAALSAPETKTATPAKRYTIIGEVEGMNPSPAALQAIFKEIDTAMAAHGYTFVPSESRSNGADVEIVTVRFSRGGKHEIAYNPNIPGSKYGWGFPEHDAAKFKEIMDLFSHPMPSGDGMERAEDHTRMEQAGTGGRH